MLTIPHRILSVLALCFLTSQACAEQAPTYSVQLKVFSAEKLVEQSTATLKDRQAHHWTGSHDGVNFDVTLTLAELNAREALYSQAIKVTRTVKPGTNDICSNGPAGGRVVYGIESTLFYVTNMSNNGLTNPAGCGLVVTVSRVNTKL